ncbi:hypothetical protein J19TS1_48190 [Heyndrickxia oleronia]|nr:hypothetical protein [Heyndrickxia oleronia]GIN41870.1 hypothetical protein J19TS1_48190 [Heyndrickxia oleronia]
MINIPNTIKVIPKRSGFVLTSSPVNGKVLPISESFNFPEVIGYPELFGLPELLGIPELLGSPG